MDITVYLFIVSALMLLIIVYLISALRRVRTQLALIKDALEDIEGGELEPTYFSRRKRHDKENLLWY